MKTSGSALHLGLGLYFCDCANNSEMRPYEALSKKACIYVCIRNTALTIVHPWRILRDSPPSLWSEPWVPPLVRETTAAAGGVSLHRSPPPPERRARRAARALRCLWAPERDLRHHYRQTCANMCIYVTLQLLPVSFLVTAWDMVALKRALWVVVIRVNKQTTI